MATVDYTAQQVTAALMQLVANRGNVRKTAEELVDDGFQVPESTLRAWKNDVHSEQYTRLEEQYGKELEREAIEMARSTMLRTANLETRVLDRIDDLLDPDKPGTIDARDLPQTLRSLTDTKAKTTDRLLSLTGRPVQPKDPAGNDLAQLVLGMVDRGLVRLAAGVEFNGETKTLPPADPPAG